MDKTRPPYSVDWGKWGKMRKIELGDACGLLAGIDLPAYRYMQALYTEQMGLEKDDYDYGDSWAEELRRSTDQAASRLIAKANITEVAQNHISSERFIDIELKKLSHEETARRFPYEDVSEKVKYWYAFVDLPEFGTWAKAAGYELPPEFPVTTQSQSVKSEASSKGGKARAAITQGAKEACRAACKSPREGKAQHDKPTLEECATLIHEDMREEIEDENNVTLPRKRDTIRGYLKTSKGEPPI